VLVDRPEAAVRRDPHAPTPQS